MLDRMASRREDSTRKRSSIPPSCPAMLFRERASAPSSSSGDGGNVSENRAFTSPSAKTDTSG